MQPDQLEIPYHVQQQLKIFVDLTEFASLSTFTILVAIGNTLRWQKDMQRWNLLIKHLHTNTFVITVSDCESDDVRHVVKAVTDTLRLMK